MTAVIARNLGTPEAPLPPPELHCVGDGDFRAIGAEFLDHLIAVGGLTADDRVLDVGCGVGRIAVPLAGHLGPRGRYLGIDVSAAGIAWCQHHVAPLHDGFAFAHLDAHHPLYHPAGRQAAAGLRWPLADGAADLVVLTSVFTHLSAAETRWYLREIARVLAPGGRCFSTWFLLDGEETPTEADPRLRFARGADGAFYDTLTGVPTAAVAYGRDWLFAEAAAAGLAVVQFHRGRWSGDATGLTFQDVALLRAAAAPDGGAPS
ncbi:class I SAM-dependent methyltransferase [Azospirillum picis]|uniref:SAM-dependent methyltransferase n=1 Tax=Azospirillum picis TaxID=488438 RepID=A0ABU0MUK8_9PROT|nr:class I SAM-dependent methyltransferase [Azospirillum picis]MBP2300900.1 SAM-dependent methyltransferase [Azospirillum picis]MDQ0537004.1 SAM-dependent methyltransferase [Azospirillum picis]